MQDYLEKYGGETKEEEEMRMQVQGFQKNFKLEEQKKEYEWANDEVEEIKFDDVDPEQEGDKGKNEQETKEDVGQQEAK